MVVVNPAKTIAGMVSTSDGESGSVPDAPAWVYLLRCGDGSLYTGWTTDVARRMAAHGSGRGSRYTRSRLPVTLAAALPMPDRTAARREEARIKALTRAQKLAIVAVAARRIRPDDDGAGDPIRGDDDDGGGLVPGDDDGGGRPVPGGGDGAGGLIPGGREGRTVGMESVWEFPRPPAVVPCARRVRIIAGDKVLADSTRALRVLETSHPPAIYVPPSDVLTGALVPGRTPGTWCEYKGRAHYLDLALDGRRSPAVGWTYPEPAPRYAALRDHIAFYPSRVDEAWLDDERVEPQAGDFYGGWITSDLVGPFKGAPGTLGW